MNIDLKIKYLAAGAVVSVMIAGTGVQMLAQEQSQAQAAEGRIMIEPLFEYPVAPDSIVALQDRSDYLLEHFWDQMKFSDKSTVDQNALNDAFRVYSTPMRFGSAQVAMGSTDRLIQRIAKNPVLSLQFAKAAEEVLYGPRADAWNDHIYLKFIDNLLANKQVKKERKIRYEHHKKLLQNTLIGSVPPEFDYRTPEGKKSHYEPNGVITVIEFGDPDCDDCRFARLKMETNVAFSELVDKGKINVLFVYVDPEDGWEDKLKDYPVKWHVGASDEVSELYDLRNTPSIYVIDREGKVAAKNVNIQTAMAIATGAANY